MNIGRPPGRRTAGGRSNLIGMQTVAEIRIPDSALAREAEALLCDVCPTFLVGHCRRTYVFGSLAAIGAGLKVNAELAYVASLLHDLGLVEKYATERRFEVDGAEAARDWALSRGLSPDDAQVVWDAVALHTSRGIADLRSPECAVVHWGAGLDVAGFGAQNFEAAAVQAVHDVYPRDGFAAGMAALVAGVASRNPAAYALTWLSATAQRCGGAPLPNSDNMLGRDPFAP
jgi:hypothetical protein